MTCAEFNDAVVDFARGVALGDEAGRHAVQCDACREALEEQREISEGLKLLAADVRAGRPSAFVEQNLVGAFRANAAAARTASSEAEQGRGYWLRAAAAVLVVFGLGAWLLLSGGATTGGQIAADRTDDVLARPAANEFVPVLGYGPVTTEDSGVVVRVLLPEDAFQYFAVPVTRIPGGQRFPADVLIADDGSVRAIRLVSDTGGRR